MSVSVGERIEGHERQHGLVALVYSLPCRSAFPVGPSTSCIRDGHRGISFRADVARFGERLFLLPQRNHSTNSARRLLRSAASPVVPLPANGSRRRKTAAATRGSLERGARTLRVDARSRSRMKSGRMSDGPPTKQTTPTAAKPEEKSPTQTPPSQGDRPPPPAPPPSAATSTSSTLTPSPSFWERWDTPIAVVGGICGVLGLVASVASAWSGWDSARSAEASERIAEKSLAVQRSESEFSRALARADEEVRLVPRFLTDGSLEVVNLSSVGVEQVEILVAAITYSTACQAVVNAGHSGPHTTPWKRIEQIPPGGRVLVDAGPDYLAKHRRAQVIAPARCAPGRGFVVDPALADADLIDACSPESPCPILTHVELRALHPKTYRWFGADADSIIHADGGFADARTLGSLMGHADGGAEFDFWQEDDRRMVSDVADWLARVRPWDRAMVFDTPRSFYGLGIFKAVGRADVPVAGWVNKPTDLRAPAD